MEFQRYDYLSRRQSPGLSESELIFYKNLCLDKAARATATQ